MWAAPGQVMTCGGRGGGGGYDVPAMHSRLAHSKRQNKRPRLCSIYPPLFAALLVYSIGGTAASIAIGRPLVGLNFQQEAREANFR